ncbi:MAG: succinate--CoA ligase subunit alpha [Deltaproteobacteria bacterium]|nr:succinate--CoA ligase subunit alpha [Deltaproteobacteria bacterium]MBN2670388.1 succinate--CoA ligase subunit alpha [Deltaproteobacteria bacterium]
MTILLNKKTRVCVQGITGGAGAVHTRKMIEAGTNVVSGVTPGKGGATFDDRIPIFDTVVQAKERSGANASVIFVPAAYAADTIMDAAYAGMELVVCVTEGIPAVDMVKVRSFIKQTGTQLIGPNCPGIIAPTVKQNLGIIPYHIAASGRVGVISRSGTLTYEAMSQLTSLGIGQSTCIGIGGDPIGGMDFVDCLKLFEEDADTDAVVMIGEIGGVAEEEAAEFISSNVEIPVVAFIAGSSAPPGKRMGHAGAIISGGKGTAAAKIRALEKAGVVVASSPAEIGKTLLATGMAPSIVPGPVVSK